ncbi:MAG TPA: cob(I)yrinic acid a,c-diamide adenosyltransferase [Caulobacteraceae bacterium]
MVRLTKIYTRTGDGGDTGLATGARVRKTDLRVSAYGDVDEANACVGLARLHTADDEALDPLLARIQNELFDLGADLATPQEGVKGWEPLRIIDAQVTRLEADLDRLNEDLPPLDSFVLPAGSPVAAALHLARTVARRAERSAVALQDSGEQVTPAALKYLNRLSDLLFVAARYANKGASGDVLWRPGATR